MKKKVKKAVAKQPVRSNDLLPVHKMDMWLKNNYNVLFSGKHGVGKTSIILDAFKRAGLRYAYFSGATMDPFIDFVGVPVKVKHPKTGVESIELLRPKHLEDKDIQAIFIDEYNRSHKKIRNAVMELIQFKTINGKPISKDLRVVWAAVNPDDDEGTYDVDAMDPAQEDRFQVKQEIPFKCSLDFFKHKYGDKGETAVEFWNKLEPKIRDTVSPRRMDYALDMFMKGGDIRDVLPLAANPSKLFNLLKGKGYLELDPLLSDAKKATEFFADESNYASYMDDVIRTKKFHSLLALFPPEKISALLVDRKRSTTVKKVILKMVKSGFGTGFQPVLDSIVKANQNSQVAGWASLVLRKFRQKLPQGVVEAAVKQAIQAEPNKKWTTWQLILKLRKLYEQGQIRTAVNRLKNAGQLLKSKGSLKVA